MRDSTASERPVMIRGYPFIRLKSGRMTTFWEQLGAAEKAHTDVVRAVSRAVKLAKDDDALERVEWFVDYMESYVAAVRAHVNELRGVHNQRERIALLRQVEGRTPEEAEEFNRKADELERRLQDER